MFAGIDSESTFSTDSNQKLNRSKSAYQPSHKNLNQNPFLDPIESAARVSLVEEGFGWSGSVSGIRGRDDRQIERDVDYERKMAERSRIRHERKLARQKQAQHSNHSNHHTHQSHSKSLPQIDPPSYDRINQPHHVLLSSNNNKSSIDNHLSSSHQPTSSSSSSNNHPPNPSPSQNLNRAKTIRDKVEAALGKWNSISRSKSMSRSKSVSALPTSIHKPHSSPPPPPRKEGLIALSRRISKKLTIEDQERRRRERQERIYAEPPLLSHTLVGAASPFPMRPALSTLVPVEQLKYGEAHTDYSPNPYRRRRNLSEHRRITSSNLSSKPLSRTVD